MILFLREVFRCWPFSLGLALLALAFWVNRGVTLAIVVVLTGLTVPLVAWLEVASMRRKLRLDKEQR